MEFHFNDRGRIASAKVLTYGLDKARLNRLMQEERSYHVFYQFLAGATTQERDHFALEDPSDYALLASSGCYRLPSGPFSDDSIAMNELRAAMRTLGFKPKHMSSIFSLLVAILHLGNLQFAEGDAHDVSAYVANPQVLDQAARLLGVDPENLSQILTNKTSYVRKELYTVLLNAQQSSAQRDHFVRDLYAILFAFVVETANHRIAAPAKDPPPSTQIVMLDQPGFQARGPAGTGSVAFAGSSPLISAYGQNGFEEFCINFADEVINSYILRNTFEDAVGYNSHMTGDGVVLPEISTMDNSACIELLRGAQLSERATRKPGGILGVMSKACSALKAGKGGDRRDDDMLQELASRFGVHASFIPSPSVGGAVDKNLFGINHYSGPCSYDVTNFVEKDADLLDSAFVSLLRNSTDSFVSKLLSGPSLAAEKHSKDESIIVQTQVSSRPLRQPTSVTSADQPASEDHARLDPGKVFAVTTQLNFTLSEIATSLQRARLWTISCIRPNDSGSSNSFDKRRVKAQIRSLLLPDIVSRRSVDYVADFDQEAFCERYVPTMRGSPTERITQCARANGWKEGVDFVVGHRMIWLSYPAWKMVEDTLRAVEKEQKKATREGPDDDESIYDDNTDFTHPEGGLAPPDAYYNESADNLLLTRTGTNGTHYHDPHELHTPNLPSAHGHTDPDDGEAGWGSEWDKKRDPGAEDPSYVTKEVGGLIVNPTSGAVEEVPSSRSRRIWLVIVWAMTGWAPSFLLRWIGRMKRPDVRLAWREKLTIFLLILLLNAMVIFYIVEFGRLLCPNFDRVWATNEVAQHTGSNDFWVAIQGNVYDVTNFIQRDHSDIKGEPSNGADTLQTLAGQELTGYFPPPLILACPGLVTDPTLSLTVKNVTTSEVTAIHLSGHLQTNTGTKLHQDDWYTAVFQQTMKQYHKGPLVWSTKELRAQASDTSIAR
jgi:chitin synthase